MKDLQSRSANLTAVKIIILYLVAGFLWILSTDIVVLHITDDPVILTRYQTYKGFIFIALTGTIFFFLLLYYLRRIERGLDQLNTKKGELEFTLSNIQGIVYRLKIEDGRVRPYWISEGVKEILGYEKEEVLSPEWWARNAERHKGFDKWIDELLKKGELTLRYCAIRKDGSSRCLLNRARIIKAKDGKPIEIVGLMTDITELKKIEDELKELTKTQQAIFDASPVAIIAIDPDGIVTSWSRSATRIFGWKDEEVLGKPNPIIRDDSEELRILAQRMFKGESISNIRLLIPRKDGVPVNVSLSTAPIMGADGKPSSIIMTIIDITEHVKLEEQLRHVQKMEAIGELAGGIAHEFNNLITAILGYTRLLDERVEEESIRNYLKVIIDASKRASELTKGLLAFSRRQISTQRPLNLNDTVRGAVQILRGLIGEDIEIGLDIHDEKLYIMADPTQLEQILINFATNARDAMPGGGIIRIETQIKIIDEEFVRSHGYGKPGRYATIVFSDTGVGMDDYVKQRIFEPFFTTKEPGKGTGLGLSLVYGIVKQHGGYIDVQSEPGKGSTFTVYFPLLEKVREEEVKLEKASTVSVKAEGTVLVAEDDLPVRKLVKRILEDAGYRVIEAENGEDAVRKFTENKSEIRFTIIDVVMPKKNGRQVLEEIRKINPAVKAIFMSGYPKDIIHHKGIFGEGVEILMKPFTPEEVFDKIRKLIAN